MQPTTVGANIRRLRNQLERSAEALAIKAGVTRATIHNLETGVSQDIKLSTLDDIATALGVDIHSLTEPFDG